MALDRILPLVLLIVVGNSLCSGDDVKPVHFLRKFFDREDLTVDPSATESYGDALFLTPYIQSGDAESLETARNLALVDTTDLGYNITSYAGYITVNEDYNSNMYFWFFPATETDSSTAPVVLWLQGGPGASSLFGLFVENGPFYVQYADREFQLFEREYSWTRFANVIYIDNPVGTGFSFTEDEAGYAKTETDVGRDLYAFFLQFFVLFDSYADNEFYISGESYAGKYVPALAYTIFTENPTADLVINLQGVAIGDGYTDPFTMMNYADVLYNVGFLDDEQRDHMYELQNRAEQRILEQNWAIATAATNEILGYFEEQTGYTNMYNYILDDDPNADSPYDIFVNLARVRSAMHTGNKTYSGGAAVYINLYEDTEKSVKPWVESLVNSGQYRIMFYNGLLDIICGHTLTQQVLGNLLWDGREAFLTSKRLIWYVDNDVAGYVRQSGTLMHVNVRNAGHMVPSDQPAFAYDMMYRFVTDSSFGYIPSWE